MFPTLKMEKRGLERLTVLVALIEDKDSISNPHMMAQNY